ncbi:unnamed protein product [Dovyalis caffra]|uniref:Phytol kinase n=1 Tax=Dovyalis caffra TaxID=77055 RepID=A0AAV1R8E0_9ROSI|nr:unnamed protein product [Dovyalis caffra]
MCTTKLYCFFCSPPPSLRLDPRNTLLSNLKPTFIFTPYHRINNNCTSFEVGFQGQQKTRRRSKGDPTTRTAVAMLHQNPVVSDLIATGLSASIALSVLRFFEETAKRHVFDQKLNRKLVHVSIGLVFMLCWPMFSSGHRGALLAAFTPGVNIIRMLLIGSGMWKDEATVKSMSRFGDRRELLKGPLYYALTITVACAIYWRTSPVAIAAICNLDCRHCGKALWNSKIPYNRNKSIAGSVAMALAGFLASVGFMYYFASFGYVQESWEMILGFLVVSLASTFVESLPISTELDDNLTVTLTSILLGNLVF